MRCDKECLQCWSKRSDAERWVTEMIRQHVPDHRTCHGEYPTSEPTATMTCHDQLMARSETIGWCNKKSAPSYRMQLYISDDATDWCGATLYYTKAPSTPATMSKQQATLSKLRSTLSKQHSTNGNNVERFYCKLSSFRQCRMLLRHCCRFWQQCCRFRQQCRTKCRLFDKVETNLTCSICFDLVERTKFRSTLLMVWPGLNGGSAPMLSYCWFLDASAVCVNNYYDRWCGCPLRCSLDLQLAGGPCTLQMAMCSCLYVHGCAKSGPLPPWVTSFLVSNFTKYWQLFEYFFTF